MRRSLLLTAASCLSLSLPAVPLLPEFTVTGTRVANPEPASSLPTLASALRAEPLVDLQSRGLAESQSDVSVRGGLFDATVFSLGAVNFNDPQTGHYASELPVDPDFLGGPHIRTGFDNALRGSASVATIARSWAPMKTGGLFSVSAGDNGFNAQRVRAAYVTPKLIWDKDFGAEISAGHSEGDGTRTFSDHYSKRTSARLQLRDADSQTDFVAGYEAKQLGGQRLYVFTLPLPEQDSLQTTLWNLNHKQNYGTEGSWVEAGAAYRRVRDNYDTDRNGITAPTDFRHETDLTTLSFGGTHAFSAFTLLHWQTQAAREELDYSSSLTFGPAWTSRESYRVSLAPEQRWEAGQGTMGVKAGGAFSDDNRFDGRFLPLAGLDYQQKTDDGSLRHYLEYAETAQAPNFTTLKSNPAGGIFRGDPTAGLTTAKNLELGSNVEAGVWKFHGAAFARREQNVHDWIAAPAAARSSVAADVDTLGVELLVSRSFGSLEVVGGYGYLHKDADYSKPAGAGSFYTLNFPIHRATAALVWTPVERLSLRLDNEIRHQEASPIRTSSRDAYIASFGISWRPPLNVRQLDLELYGSVDNLTNTSYQEIPGTLPEKRSFSVGATVRF